MALITLETQAKCRSDQYIKPLWDTEKCCVRAGLAAAIPMENPYCSCKLTARRSAACEPYSCSSFLHMDSSCKP